VEEIQSLRKDWKPRTKGKPPGPTKAAGVK
jgi:hypothetical protein